MLLQFVLEGMEESGSEGLDELLYAEKEKFLNDVDFVCISDNYWLGKSKPCITYGLRGICYFHINISCATKDLHSGVFGGAVYVNFRANNRILSKSYYWGLHNFCALNLCNAICGDVGIFLGNLIRFVGSFNIMSQLR